jgi:hypothetical protein
MNRINFGADLSEIVPILERVKAKRSHRDIISDYPVGSYLEMLKMKHPEGLDEYSRRIREKVKFPYISHLKSTKKRGEKTEYILSDLMR